MPASSDLLKVLAEDPKSLEQQIGCMTGIFQIFDRHQAFIGRRYGSKRVSNASGQSQPTSACDTPRLDRSNPYWMFEDDSSRRISADSFDRPKGALESSKEHHRAYSDNSEIFTKSFETPTESRTSPDQKSQLDLSPMYSEESVGGLAFYYNESIRENTISATDAFEHADLSQRETNKSESMSAMAFSEGRLTTKDPLQPTADIRDVVRASFTRERPRDMNTKEKPRISVDGNQSLGYLKNLPRSSSVDGRDAFRMSVDGRETGLRKPADLPRSASVDGRGGSRMLADWRDGPRHSSGSPRITIKDKEKLKPATELKELPRLSVDRNVSNYHSSTEVRDVTRLTVELKEGPRLSVSMDDRRVFNDGKVSPRLISNSRYQEASDLPLAGFDFKESLRAADFKDSLRTSQKYREGPRFSVDGTRDAPRATLAPRLSVDGRDSAHSCAVPRRLKLDGKDLSRTSSRESNRSTSLHQKAEHYLDKDAEGDMRRRSPNVVARLMGLEELPSSDQSHNLPSKVETRLKEASLLQGFLQYNPHKGSPPPPPPPPDDYDYMYQRNDGFRHSMHGCSDHDVLQSRSRPPSGRHRQRETDQRVQNHEDKFQPQYASEQRMWCHQEESNDHYSQVRPAVAPKQQFLDNCHPASKHQELQHTASQEHSHPPKQPSAFVLDALKHSKEESIPLSDPLSCNLDQKVQQLRSKQSKLWQILEAVQLKGLLNGSRRKQSEAAKLQIAKQIEEKQQDLKQQQPSMPRLLVTASRQDYIRPDYQDKLRVSVPLSFNNADYDAQDQPVNSIAHVKSNLLQSDGRSTDYETEEAAIVVMKPILTRSTSRSQASNLVSVQPRDAGTAPSKSSNAGRYTSTSRADAEEENLPRTDRGTIRNVNPRVAVNEAPLKAQAYATTKDALNETGSKSTLDTDTLTSLRQARKERVAARTAKCSSDVPSSRDSSPRGPRSNPHPQEKPRPSPSRESSPLSPRCPGSMESVRTLDAGRARRKSFAVKDREETKASLVNLRATATKQEFLKGRASGDPDTPRLRRTNSDSKLLSKIAERPVISDVSTAKGAGGKSPSHMPVLKSKRPIVKDNKSPAKPRPSMKTVAKPLPPREECKAEIATISRGLSSIVATVLVPTNPALDSLPAAKEPTSLASSKTQVSSVCATSGVRITEGGAMDHSGDSAGSSSARALVDNSSESRAQSKVQEARMELDDGVKTPRGVSVKKMDFSDDEPAEVVEQPSPVSVLDNSHFEEELTPSPKAGKPSVTGLQDKIVLSETERRWSSPRFLDLDLEDAAPAPILKVHEACLSSDKSKTCGANIDANALLDKCDLEMQVPFGGDARSRESESRLRICLKDEDEERDYVKDLVVASELINESLTSQCLWSTTGYVIDPSIYDQFEINRRRTELSFQMKHSNTLTGEQRRSEEDEEKDALNRRILFDCVNEILDRKMETRMNPMRWTDLFQKNLRKNPAGQKMIQDVWNELQDIPCASSEDVCDTVFSILQKDLLRGQGHHWSSWDREIGKIGTELEKMIVKDLIEETVRDLCGLGGHKPPSLPVEATRRQLFAY